AHTKNIIIESANFNPARVRRTATRLGLRTDASLRFESGLAPEQAEYALREVVMLIEKLTGAELLGVSDTGKWQKKVAPIPLSADEINKLLGTNMDIGILKNVLEELRFEYTEQGKEVHVTPPFERLDVEMKEDLIEEVGRVYGYEKVKALPLPKAEKSPAVNKNFYYTEKIRDILVGMGFSEVYTHAIGADGNVELENPLASDKAFLRGSLANSHFASLVLKNERNKKLFDGETIKIFEIGKAFREEGEQWELVLGSENENEVRDAESALTSFGISSRGTGVVVERHVLSLEKLPEPPSAYEPHKKSEIEPRYRPISDFPPMFRDIAVFVPEALTGETVREIIADEAGKLLVGIRLFDEFRKEGKVSYAFRIVFQSHEKTLSDSNVNEIMNKVTTALNAHDGFMVR
ncbi:MAG TPA: phenylalanine--tRNA ligase beta subunit-related protein, partial [Candidatus Paceibacterota bacterium]